MLQRGQVEVPSEATPKHGRWLFNRIIVEGYKPTVAHFNTLLRVIEKHPIRHVQCWLLWLQGAQLATQS